MVQPAQRYISFEEFMIEGADLPDRPGREWIDGEVYAMSPATPEHGFLCAQMIVALHAAFRGKCVVRDSSIAVHIPTTRAGLCPDASVVCGPLIKTVVENRGKVVGQAITNPCVVVEVLSESTERYDRDVKFSHYRGIPSLEEYVLVSQMTRKIEVFRRAADWQCEVIEGSGTFVIHGATLSLDEIYAMPNIEA